jgi:hypothetical protein
MEDDDELESRPELPTAECDFLVYSLRLPVKQEEAKPA